MKTLLIIHLTVFFILSFQNSVQAQGRGEDPTFNSGTGFNGTVTQIVLQPDGKILVIGTFTEYNGFLANRIIRLNSDGSKDETFQIGTGFNNTLYKIVLQSDGKIVVGGDFTEYKGVSANRIIRLNSDGSIDTSFGIGLGFDKLVNYIALQLDGKILVSGSFTTYNGVAYTKPVIRLNADGAIDNSFNMDLSAFSGPYSSKPSASFVEIQPSGKIIVGGYFYQSDGLTPLITKLCIRFNFDGSLDNTFNSYNISPNLYSSISSITLQSDGKILIGGAQDFDINRPGLEQGFIKRLNINGDIDNTYKQSAPFPDYYIFSIQSDGKIIIIYSNYMIRYFLNGDIDKSLNTSNLFNDKIKAIATQPDGKILIGGDFTSYDGLPRSRIIRLIDGFAPLNEEETVSKISIYPNPTSDYLNIMANPDSIWQVTDTFGRVVMAGKIEKPNIQLDMRKLPQGIYILCLTDPQGNKATKRIVKQ
jgi:uncharacterized delta-60 repeat protein